MIIQNLFDTNLWYGLREINVLKSVNKCLFCQKLEKVGKKLLLLFIFQNLGNGMCQMIFLTTLDIYGVKNSLFRYLWMLKSPIFSACLVLCCFPDLEKLTKLLVAKQAFVYTF